ncbi:MAG: hypothetical protein PHZ02_14530 [Desulfocapsaceae bacterium]|nr:hypothetical protein [Desulfocapsaceae bacterium]
MNGFEIGEKLLGIASEKWPMPYAVGYYNPFRSLEPPTRYSNDKLNPNWERPVPYSFEDGDIVLDKKNSDLLKITLLKFKDGFCLTPALTREMLGEPEDIDLGEGGLSLEYKIISAQKEYFILISYKTMHWQVPKVRNYARTIIKEKQKFSQIFKDRKDSCVMRVSIINKSY